MSVIHKLLEEASEQKIAERVGRLHDETLLNFRINCSTVNSYREFEELITRYYQYHHERCVTPGGVMHASDALQKAKDLISRTYQRQFGGDINAAYSDASQGINGGVRGILNILADGLKNESESNYLMSVFGQYVTPNSFEEKVELMRGFLNHFASSLGGSIQISRPERYATNYVEVIQSYLAGLKQIHRPFRRL